MRPDRWEDSRGRRQRAGQEAPGPTQSSKEVAGEHRFRFSSSEYIKISNVYPHSKAEQKLHSLPVSASVLDRLDQHSSKELHSAGGGEKVQRAQSVARKNKAGSIYTEPQPTQPRSRCHGDACDVIIGSLF